MSSNVISLTDLPRTLEIRANGCLPPKQTPKKLLRTCLFSLWLTVPLAARLCCVGWGKRGSPQAVNIPGGLVNVLMAVMVLTEGSALPLSCRKVSDTHTSIFVTFMRVLPLAEHEQAERI